MSDQKTFNSERHKETLETSKEHINTPAIEQNPEYTLVASELAEIAEFADSIEVAGEKVSESRESASSKKATSTHQTTTAQDHAAQKRRQLIGSRQPRAKIAKDLTNFYKKELHKLEKEHRQYRHSSTQMAFQLNETWRKIKETYEMLEKLADMTYEALKKLWLRLVHGIVV